MTITSIQQQKKDLNRVNIFIDEIFWLGLSKNELVKLGLFKGKEISDKEKSDIESISIGEKIVEKIKKYVSFRPRSKKEIKDYVKYKILNNLDVAGTAKVRVANIGAANIRLENIGASNVGAAYPAVPELNQIISACENLQLIDDEKFADWFVRQRLEFGVHGFNKIRAELLKKGVEKNLIDQIFKKYNDMDEYKLKMQDNLKNEIEKMKKSIKAKSKYDLENKIIRRLVGKGFRFEEIKKAINS